VTRDHCEILFGVGRGTMKEENEKSNVAICSSKANQIKNKTNPKKKEKNAQNKTSSKLAWRVVQGLSTI